MRGLRDFKEGLRTAVSIIDTLCKASGEGAQ